MLISKDVVNNLWFLLTPVQLMLISEDVVNNLWFLLTPVNLRFLQRRLSVESGPGGFCNGGFWWSRGLVLLV